MSYFLVNYLTIQAFHENQDKIQEICGKKYFRIRNVHVDFEYAIHWAFKSWGKIKGCYFHLTQALWRRVQHLGMARHYNNDKSLKMLIRCVVALPFVPKNMGEAVLDNLRELPMNKDSPHYEEFVKFQEEFLDYFELTYIRGNYDPEIWNLYGRWKQLTNNISEGYNSKLMKLVSKVTQQIFN